MVTPPTRRHHDAHPAADASVVRVLLVDDDENFRAWLTRIMRGLGFTVESSSDGANALARLREKSFDLVISDYQMPRVDGFDLIRSIRSDAVLCYQYSVMLTSRDDLESKVAALTAGYDDFLAKGCTEVEVIAKVVAAKRLVSRQRLLELAAREWQELATRDELTGVATRRTLFELAERYLANRRTVGLAILDLDEFKPINDTHGHLAGDRILRDLGALFIRCARADDLFARYGGDEFLLLVVDVDLDDLVGATERIIAEMTSLQWTLGESTVSISATAGVAHSSLIEKATLEQLLDAADRDLYARKWLKKHPSAVPVLRAESA